MIICFKFKGSVNQVWKIVDATQTVYLWKRNGKSYDDLCKYLNYFNADHTHSIFEGIQERISNTYNEFLFFKEWRLLCDDYGM